MDFMRIFSLVATILNSVKDGKIDEGEVKNIIAEVLKTVASIKGKPLSDQQALDGADGLIGLYKMFS